MLITKSKEWIIDDTIIALDLAQRMLIDAINVMCEESAEDIINETYAKIEECKKALGGC